MEKLILNLLLSALNDSVADGGPGSGDFGHKGRPGLQGGSAKENDNNATLPSSDNTSVTVEEKYEYVKCIPEGNNWLSGEEGIKIVCGNKISYLPLFMMKEEYLQRIKGYPQQREDLITADLSKPIVNKVNDLSVQKYQNIQDAYSDLKSKGHCVDNIEKLEQYPWKQTATMIDSMRTFAKEFPNYKLNLELLDIIPSVSAVAMRTTSSYLPEDLMNEEVSKYFAIGFPTKKQGLSYREDSFQTDRKPSNKRGLNPPNCNWDAILYHELWHALGNEMIRQSYEEQSRFEREYALNDYEFALFYEELSKKRKTLSRLICYDAVYNSTYIGNDGIKKNAQKISQYATLKDDETIAEAFADVYANGNNASQYSINIYAVAKKYANMQLEELKKAIDSH